MHTISIKQFAVFLLAADLAFAASSCTCKKQFHISIDRANWFQAFINCKNAGMELASPENEEESKALDAYLNPIKGDDWGNGFWLSGTNYNNPTSKQFFWFSSGKRVIFTRWIEQEPDNYQGVQHNTLWGFVNGRTGWGDANANATIRYVCETKDCSSCPPTPCRDTCC